MREYYIRREGDEDSSGPFDLDQISSLMEAGKLDTSAYFYDIESETWKPISSNQEMMDTLFPKKQKLSLRTKEVEEQRKQEEEAAKAKAAEEAAMSAENQNAAASEQESAAAASTEMEGAPAADGNPAPATAAKSSTKKEPKLKKPEEPAPEKIEVTRMLAMAEGRADDPTGKSPREKKAAVAYFGLRLLTLFFIGSIASLVYLDWELVMTADAVAMAKSPYLLIAAFDLIVTVVLLLQVTEIYPLVRFRAAIGAGFLSVLFYGSGDDILLVSNLLLMVAIYFASAIVKIRYLLISALMGMIGLFGYIYSFLF